MYIIGLTSLDKKNPYLLPFIASFTWSTTLNKEYFNVLITQLQIYHNLSWNIWHSCFWFAKWHRESMGSVPFGILEKLLRFCILEYSSFIQKSVTTWYFLKICNRYILIYHKSMYTTYPSFVFQASNSTRIMVKITASQQYYNIFRGLYKWIFFFFVKREIKLYFKFILIYYFKQNLCVSVLHTDLVVFDIRSM